jgi:hypothetical protein
MKRSTVFPVLVSVLALSTALGLASQHLARDSSLERANFSEQGMPAQGPSRHAVTAPSSLGAREEAPSAAPGWPTATSVAREATAGLDPGIYDRIRIDEVAPNVYVVSAMDLLIALSQADALMATVQPMLSFNSGPQYWIDSLVIEGILTGQGFRVTAPKLVRRAGIEPGDTLRTVNGRPIDHDVNVQALLREVSKNPLNSVIRLEVERQGVTLTKTYRLG